MQFQKQKYSKLATILEQKQGVLFCGAGISLEPPAGLPDWHNLRDSTIKAVISRASSLQPYIDTLIHMDMLEQPGKKGLTPEYVASVISLSSENYFECFGALKKGEPNLNHRYIAKIAKEGYLKFIITTNFDMFIEKALAKEEVPFIVYTSNEDFKNAQLDKNFVHLFKLHGCIDHPETITVTIEQETRGLSVAKQNLLISLLQQYTFILGYSGADLKIDLDYLKMISAAPQAKGFIWNFYSTTESINPHVKDLVQIYKDKAEIVAKRLPDIFNDFFCPDDQIQSEIFTEEQRLLLQKERDNELSKSLDEWASNSLRKEAAVLIIARLLKHSGHIDEAKSCYQMLFEMLDRNDAKTYCSACNEIGYIYKLQGDYTKAIEYFEEIKNIANKTQDKNLLILSYNSMGGIYLVWNHVNKALDCYQQAKQIAIENKDYRGLAFAYSKLGLLYKKQQRIQQALDYFEKAKKLCLEIGDKIGHAINLDNIGKIYRNQREYGKALNCFEEAKKITISLGDKQGLAVRLTSIATVYEKTQKLEKALENYCEAHEIAKELGDKNGMMLHSRNMAHVYEKQQRIKEAISMYEESYQYSTELKQRKQSMMTMNKIEYLKAKEQKEKMTKTILITGACGYLGSITTEALHQHKDIRIIALDIRKPKKELENVSYEISDICSPEETQKVFAKYNVDIVVHLAAIIPGKKSNPELEYKVDVIGTKNVLDACIHNNVKKVIISSSGAAYGYHSDNPEWIKETDRIRGNDSFPYSKHKRLVEEMLLEYREKYPQLKQVVFRIGTILGKNVNNQLAALFERKHVIAIKGSDSRFVFIWDEDVCGAILHAIFSDKEGIFNVAGDGALSIYEIASILKKKTRIFSPGILKFILTVLYKIGISPYGPEKIIFLQYRPVLDNHRLKTVFGYIPKKHPEKYFSIT